MAQTLWIATRKGLFAATRGDGGWTVSAPPSFLGEPVTMMLDDPRDGELYAALNLGHFGVKLHRSGDRGRTWQECAAPSMAFASPDAASSDGATSDTASTDTASTDTASTDGLSSDTAASASDASAADRAAADAARAKAPAMQLVWALEAGRPGTLWAGTIPGALFRSTDRAQTWEPVRSLWDRPERGEWFGGGYDQPGIHSIVVDPRDPTHVTVGVSCGGAWFSADDGATWENRSRGMIAAYMPPGQQDNPNIQDPHRLVACPAAPDVLWTQHHNGVFRSTDAGRTWHDVAAARPSGFGFAVAVHPRDPDTAWFVPAVKDECRVPVNGALVVSRTRDGGQTFDVLADGLPSFSYDLVYRHALDVDRTGDTLAFGSTTGGLWVTEDGGDHWQTVSVNLPPIYCVRFGQ